VIDKDDPLSKDAQFKKDVAEAKEAFKDWENMQNDIDMHDLSSGMLNDE
jgi:hypothetical protein